MPAYLFYTDESFNQEKFCLSAIAIRHSDWRDCFKAALEHRRMLKADYGLFLRKEIHAHEFIGGRGHIADSIISKHTRSRIFFGLLNLIAQLPVRLFNVCLEVKGRRDPQLDAWERLLNRIERSMLEQERVEIPKRKDLLTLIPEVISPVSRDELSARLLSYHARALIFADEGRQEEITKIFRKMTVFNPIPSRFGQWSGATYRNIPLERMIEDPVFKKSHQSFFIQLADCAAFALLKRETAPTPNIKKYRVNEFFDQCLAKICWKRASREDPLGIVRQ